MRARRRAGIILIAVATWLTLGPPAVLAQPLSLSPIRIRGVIEKIDEGVLTIRTREGNSVVVQVSHNRTMIAVTRATVADIKPGLYVGAPALPQPGGIFKAQAIVLFPDAARGANEGHYAWDLTPESTMTNATVRSLVSQASGTILTLKHKDGETSVMVTPETPIVRLLPGDWTLIAVGAAVFVPAQQAADGSISAVRLMIGKDGLVPPM